METGSQLCALTARDCPCKDLLCVMSVEDNLYYLLFQKINYSRNELN